MLRYTALSGFMNRCVALVNYGASYIFPSTHQIRYFSRGRFDNDNFVDDSVEQPSPFARSRRSTASFVDNNRSQRFEDRFDRASSRFVKRQPYFEDNDDVGKGNEAISYINDVTLLGEVYSEPKLITGLEEDFAQFSIVTKDISRGGRRFDDDSDQLQPDKHRIEVSGSFAKRIMSEVQKSSTVMVKGQLKTKRILSDDGGHSMKVWVKPSVVCVLREQPASKSDIEDTADSIPSSRGRHRSDFDSPGRSRSSFDRDGRGEYDGDRGGRGGFDNGRRGFDTDRGSRAGFDNGPRGFDTDRGGRRGLDTDRGGRREWDSDRFDRGRSVCDVSNLSSSRNVVVNRMRDDRPSDSSLFNKKLAEDEEPGDILTEADLADDEVPAEKKDDKSK